MDKSAIIEFSNKVRDKLSGEVRSQTAYYGITPKEVHAVQEHADSVVINGKVFNSRIKNQRSQLVKQIKEKGYEQVMEEVTYTWFNRLVALKFMEMNGCLPDQIKVFTSTEPNKPEPDLLTNALKLDFLDLNRDLVLDLKVENKDEELYKYLILKLCNYLHKIMSFLFEKIEDYTELLFPDKLLHTGSVLHDLNSIIPDEDWQEVEIVGWIYQDYIAPKKDKVFADLKNNIKISKENIPAVTQLFTPKWIAKYLVENSLGRLWLESNPDPVLKSKFKYFIEQEALATETIYNPEEIKVLDPAMGSGHILVYAFEILYEIYRSVGYLDSEIAPLILNYNLYGLEIDDRAAQLAGFAVMMKAREYDKDLFSKEIELNLCSIQETNNIDYLDEKRYPQMKRLFDCFFDAKEYGSILELPEFKIEILENEFRDFKQNPLVGYFSKFDDPYNIIKQFKIMVQKYDCVITNPPYMGSRNMNQKMASYVQKEYKDSKSDLFAVFIQRCLYFTKVKGYSSLVTQQTWMFISSYTKLRKRILTDYTIYNLIQIGFNSFPDLNSKLALACAFTIKKTNNQSYKGTYLNLNDVSKTANKELVFFEKMKKNEIYKVDSGNLLVIKDQPIAYWVSNKVRAIFKNNVNLENRCEIRQGMATTNNSLFLRFWNEVSINKIGFNLNSEEEAGRSGLKWFPYNKGGEFRKWYGNNDYIVNYENKGKTICDYIDNTPGARVGSNGRVINRKYYFKKSITWSFVSWVFGVRSSPRGFIFDIGGSSLFSDEENYNYILGILCSKIATKFLEIINPSLNYQVGDVSSIPLLFPKSNGLKSQIDLLTQECIKISKEEWDFNETSWDFKTNEFLRHKTTSRIEDAYANCCIYWKEKFLKLHANEEELNKIFIDIYNLGDELSPDVSLEEITILKEEAEIKKKNLVFKREIIVKKFLSYAVGCMFGRYSPEKEGLILANLGGKLADFREKIPGASFLPDEDNIIPILDDEYYTDDIVGRFKEFLKLTFGVETLSENLDFIAGTLSKKNEAPEKVIRNYFLRDFYSDHVKMYKKRPIYWLFTSSEKGKAFNALVYMHRYDKTTLAKMRIDYLLDFEAKLHAQRSLLEIENSNNRGKAESELAKLKKKIDELVKYDELLKNKADQMIEIDLDDGVVENYKKFEGLVGKI